MASEIRVNSITNRSGLGTVTFSDTGVVLSGVSTFTVSSGSTSAPSISPTGDSNTGIFFPSPDTIAFAEGGVEALRITSASRVGLGTNIPDSYDSGARTLVIDESGSLAGMTIRSSTQGAVYFADGLTGNEAYRGRIEYSHSTDALNFGTAGTGSKLSLTSGGDVQIANGNLVFSTSGKGIDFSATANSSGTMTSELLSDYEEGFWTPTLSNFSGTPSYQYQEGFYTKIGRYVIAQGIMGVTNSNTLGSGAIRISLPFTASATGSYGFCGPVADGSGFPTASFPQFGTMVAPNNSYGSFVTIDTSALTISYNQPSATWYVRFNFMYLA